MRKIKKRNLTFSLGFALFFLGIPLLAQEDPYPTPQSVDFYGEAYINGTPVKKGDVITAYDPNGILCGKFVVQWEGHFGFMPVYADDPTTSEDEGAKPGDIITFKINGKPALVTVKKINKKRVEGRKGNSILPRWSKDGDLWEVKLEVR